MRRIKLAIVATCAAVTAATITTPAYAADVEPNTLAALSEEVKENGVLKTAYMVLWEVAMLPVALSISLSVEPGMI
ncbi:hypothetical protein [Corynebacterium matruchotii]|uniref:Uncharacterized protein n=2 Tax=Corynebacterium matruchotii TaxID=43768 RepID=E0DHG2_9CORY|nr:hypothetical protein [Corynebacterium matruchotii]EFM48347.1 hypothetical protein HMPREF0299_5114 [Corynebacterium matruchotii ATCC 14266]KAB1922969.1 hypothetical protein F8196_11560 [Corynebacterium matruchotii]QIP45307.1 hypothetical protein HBA49_07105 [Corynebacterium matruchotii]SPW24462.1 Uncharacterised protein [Corynebacterium matruchotii]